MRVLLTNNALDLRAGTETVLLDVARALRRRGHEPWAYSTRLGAVARELEAEGVRATDDLGGVPAPDLIHGQHHVETMTALLAFPGVPAVYVCHGALPWEEAPPLFPRIRLHVAVDDPCRERCLAAGVAPERVRVLRSFVDLERFAPRTAPLPPRPRRALVFSHYASPETHLDAVRAACRRERIACDVLGEGSGRASASPHEVLGSYDLVFAKGRAALEALATGAAVVLCDARGAGPMVTFRDLNLGFRTLTKPLDPAAIRDEIRRYDAADARAVSARIRATAGLEAAIDALLAIYGEAVAAHRASPPASAEEESRAAARYVRFLGDLAKEAASAAGYRAAKRRRRDRDRGALGRLLRGGRRRRG